MMRFEFHASLYRKLLWAYPPDLRRDFGDEMAMIFAADLEQRGVIATWRCALAELATVALPGLRSNPFVIVPALSFTLVASSMSVELWLAIHYGAHLGIAKLLDQVPLGVVVPSTLSAVVGLLVTRFCAHCPIRTLRLD
jgi:hypothetical protein